MGPFRPLVLAVANAKPRYGCPANRPARITSPKPRPAPSPAPAAPEAAFQIQNLGRAAQASSQRRVRRQQRDVMAGGAIDLQEVTSPEIRAA